MLDYMEAAKKWGVSERRIQVLCTESRIDGAVRFGHAWAIPKDATKPIDARLKRNRKKGGNE
ncbi:DNA-binding protein [Blautia schinkii]|nr:DNA-binding protein [Blautia schinkii]